MSLSSSSFTGIYSPSSTLTFMQCPTLWYLRSQGGWRPKRLANPELAAAVGLGVSAAMETYFKATGSPSSAGKDTLPTALSSAVSIGQCSAQASIQEAFDRGAVLHNPQQLESTLESIPSRIEKVMRGFHAKQPFHKAGWTAFLPELVFPDHGNARADLLCKTDLGACIVDFKTKVSEYRTDDFMYDFETSWQMYHYVWAAREMGIEVVSYGLCLIIVEPLKFYTQEWAVDEAMLEQWRLDAAYWWAQMDRVKAAAAVGVPTPRSGVHRSRYGLCEMYDACFTLPPEAWHTQYSQRLHVTAVEETV